VLVKSIASMRILYDHQAFSLQSYGGITRVFSEIIRFLNQQAEISTNIFLGYSNTEANFHDIVSSPGRVLHFGRSPFRQGLVNYALNEALMFLYAPRFGEFDIYHNTLYRFSPCVRSTRRVATHHDCVQEQFPKLFPDHARIMRSKRRMFREADLVLCVSEASRKDLFHFYDVDPNRAVVVHNGVSRLDRISGGEAALRAHVTGEYLLYVGARYAYKNFDGLLRAYAESNAADRYELLVIGGGAATAAETNLIEKLQLRGRVKFVPHASPSLLAEAYALAALLIYPSLYEGFGMPPLEAASLGCPSLVASNPATREVCQDSTFYFDATSSSDFSKMLCVALSNNEERKRLVERGKALLQMYTWENCGKKTLDAYKRLR
jgi:glycosyltransferase involved in cell wall biosynthesis